MTLETTQGGDQLFLSVQDVLEGAKKLAQPFTTLEDVCSTHTAPDLLVAIGATDHQRDTEKNCAPSAWYSLDPPCEYGFTAEGSRNMPQNRQSPDDGSSRNMSKSEHRGS